MLEWTTSLRQSIGSGWNRLWDAVVEPRFAGEPEPGTDDTIAQQARLAAPVVWLVGKVQSGKTSIIRGLTGASEAEIGSGFRRCTTTARVFEFPDDAPVIRFLDTRGLGEAAYDPAHDLSFAEEQAHLVLVVMKAMDTQQEAILNALREVRRRHPEWPIVVAQTSLHEAYAAGQEHPPEYPYLDGEPKAGVPVDLVRSLAWQRATIRDLPGSGPVAFVPIDFTRAEDGYAPQAFGRDALLAAIEAAAPAALAAAVAASAEIGPDRRRAQAHPHILGYAAAAAVADIVPAAGLVAVPGVQAKMLHSLGRIYDVTWTRSLAAEFTGALGTGTVLRIATGFGARELGKFIPVYGQTAGAAAAAALSFATTYAIGKAACHFLGRRISGRPDDGEVQEAYRAAFASAVTMARSRDFRPAKPGGAGEPASGAAP